MATVLLAGGFGNGNPADEALLEAFSTALPGTRLSATTWDSAATRAAHGCEAVPASNPFAVARAVARTDATVLCGRSVFGHAPPFGRRHPSRRIAASLALLLAARARAKPRAIVGATVDPLQTPLARRLARGVVRWSDLLVLREDESVDALAAAGATGPFRIGADPTWTVIAPAWEAASRNGGDPSRDRNRIVVALGPPAAGPPALDRLAATLERVRLAGREVVLQPWQPRSARGPDDGTLARYVADQLDPPPPIAAPPRDLLEARSTFARSGLVVGLRYHALIASAAAGVPVLTLEDRPELVGLARRLGQPVASAGASPEEVADAILRGVDHQPPGRAAIEAQITAAAEGLRLLRLLVSGGRSDDADRVTGLRLEPEPQA